MILRGFVFVLEDIGVNHNHLSGVVLVVIIRQAVGRIEQAKGLPGIPQETAEESARIPDTSDSTVITLSGESAAVSGSGAEAGNGTVTITDGGTYLITGELSDGRILVNAPEKEVTIVLENTGIRCTYGSPIYIYQSRLTTLCLTEGTTNTLTDGSEYTFSDSFSSSVDEEPNACLYSKSDLVIAGSGRLIVNANYNNGIT